VSLASGTRLGPYEIVAPLGAGGMGEVYRARDTNLGRDVALKTLPERVTHDPERLARFRREAQMLAALNHPHIGSIYGLEESSGHRVLVLELVEGETLAERLQRGPMPVDEAVAIAREMAEALHAAHEKGIVHRDLKPANIALTADDRVKVLDFGLAKATDVAAPAAGDPLNSPTVTSPALLTGLGVILGTAAYMSPEQARGRTADKRSDIWAFGCVLYEMLTGQRAFKGDEVNDTLAAVIKSDPAWDALPPSLAPPLRTLLEGCLEKNPRDRVSDISTALFVLKRSSLRDVPQSVSHSSPAYWRWALLVLAGAAAGAAVTIGFWPRPEPAVSQVARFGITLPGTLPLTLSRRAVAVSPDGTRIVYVADGRLYLRSLAENDPRPLPGADPGIHPAFSPDGSELVFWSDPTLKRIAVTGGPPVTVCETTPAPFGLDWSERGIVFVQPGTGIMQVPPRGGRPAVLVETDPAQGLVHGIQLLPDGDTLLFTVAQMADSMSANFWDRGHIVAHSLKTGRRTTVVEGGSDARYLPSGHLLYVVEGTLMGVPFDLRRLSVAGAAVPVVEGVRRSSPSVGGAAQYAVSRNGVLVYSPGSPRSGQDDVYIFDRKGGATPLKLARGAYTVPRASPDGKWLALETNDGKQAAVSLYELSGGSSVRRLTFEGNNRLPIWSRDGRRIAFQSDRDGDRAIFWQSVSGGVAERLTHPEPGTSHVPESWSPRDDLFLFSATKGSETTLWTFSVRERKASRFAGVTSRGVPTNAVFSPDGRWVAYQSGTGGVAEATTYVEPFPPTRQKFEIARGGRPLWSRSAWELFYIPAPARLVAVSVRTTPEFAFSPPVDIPRRFGLAPPAIPRPYDILPDGRFVAVDAAMGDGEQASGQLQVVVNWFEELRAKVLPAR
jgi:serine/threonine-protein kinase